MPPTQTSHVTSRPHFTSPPKQTHPIYTHVQVPKHAYICITTDFTPTGWEGWKEAGVLIRSFLSLITRLTPLSDLNKTPTLYQMNGPYLHADGRLKTEANFLPIVLGKHHYY